MAMGFVYVLTNPFIPGLVKIGRTITTSAERAKELYKTGVPTWFEVVHDELVSDDELVETRLHGRFASCRVTPNREFFRIAAEDAVAALREVAAPYILPPSARENRCEILPKLQRKFPKLMASLTSVAVIQITDPDVIARFEMAGERGEVPTDAPKQLLFLQSRRRLKDGEVDVIEVQEDLKFIAGAGNDFPPGRDIQKNAAAFVDNLNLETLLVIAESLFTPEGLKTAIAAYNSDLPPEMLIEPVEIDEVDERWSRRR
jgi:hypothetical protein